MSNAIIGNKKFVVTEQMRFGEIQLLAVQKPSLKKPSFSAGKKHTYKLINMSKEM